MEDAEIYRKLGYDDFQAKDIKRVTEWNIMRCYVWLKAKVARGEVFKVGLREGYTRHKKGLYRTSSNHWHPELKEES